MNKKNILIIIPNFLNKFNINQTILMTNFLKNKYFEEKFNIYFHTYTSRLDLVLPFKKNILKFDSMLKFKTEIDFINQFTIKYSNIEFEYVINFSLILSESFRKSENLDKKIKFINSFAYTSNQNSFLYFIKLLYNKTIKYKKHYHFIYDPMEMDFSEFIQNSERIFFYSSGNMKYFPFIDYYFYNIEKNFSIFNVQKNNDFVFGCTIVTEDRRFIEPLINNLKNKFNNIYIKNKYTKEDNSINNENYNKILSISKYTLIIPSYDKNHFSLIRFFESFKNKCIPLVLDSCNIEVLKNDYIDLYKFIKQHLLVKNENDIIYKIDLLDYNFIINELNKIIFINYNNIENYFEKFFNMEY